MSSITTIALAAISLFVGGSLFWGRGEERVLVCQGVPVQLPEIAEESMKTCLKEQGATTANDLHADKIACYFKCVYTRNDVYGENGIPSKDKMTALILNSFPKETKHAYAEGIGNCVVNFGNRVNTLDEACDSYIPIGNCIFETYGNVCLRKTTSSGS